MDLNNDTQGVCVSGTWEVPEVVEFRISMNRFDVSALGAPADTRDAAPPNPPWPCRQWFPSRGC